MTLIKFFNVQLSADLGRDMKRGTIHLADRGIRLRPVDGNAGNRTLATVQDMKLHPAKYNITLAAARMLSYSSNHIGGDALDASLTIGDRKLYDEKVPASWRKKIANGSKTLYDYAEHVFSHYGLHIERENFPQYAAERNHFNLLPGAVKPLSKNALARWHKAAAL